MAVYLKENKTKKTNNQRNEQKKPTKINIQSACGFEVGYFIMIAFLLGAYAHEDHLSVA